MCNSMALLIDDKAGGTPDRYIDLIRREDDTRVETMEEVSQCPNSANFNQAEASFESMCCCSCTH